MYFLAIVGNPDIKVGNWVPSYVLCRTNGNSPNRTGWQVVNIHGRNKNANKILVRNIEDKQYMIDFMSHFRTRSHRHDNKKYDKNKTKKFYPEGMLCWFECDKYGRQCGPAIMIKRVPAEGKTDNGKAILEERLQYKPTIKELLTKDDKFIALKESAVKKDVPQYTSATMKKMKNKR